MKCPVPGTVRTCAAQPRQVRKEATVSGGMLRRGTPGTGQFITNIYQLILGEGKMYA